METKRQKYLAHVGSYMDEGTRDRVREALIVLWDAAARAARDNGNESFSEGLRSLSRSIRSDVDALEWYECEVRP